MVASGLTRNHCELVRANLPVIQITSYSWDAVCCGHDPQRAGQNKAEPYWAVTREMRPRGLHTSRTVAVVFITDIM